MEQEREYLKFSENTQEQVLAGMLTDYNFFKKCTQYIKWQYFTDPTISSLVKIAYELESDGHGHPTFAMVEAKVTSVHFSADDARKIREVLTKVKNNFDPKSMPVLCEEIQAWATVRLAKIYLTELANLVNSKKIRDFSTRLSDFKISVDALNVFTEEKNISLPTKNPNSNIPSGYIQEPEKIEAIKKVFQIIGHKNDEIGALLYEFTIRGSLTNDQALELGKIYSAHLKSSS